MRGTASVLGLVTEAEADILDKVVCIGLKEVSLGIYESVRIGALCIKRIITEQSRTS